MPAVESRRRNSFLGSLALFAGLPAIALAWFDFPIFPAVDVGPFHLKFATAVSAGALSLAMISLLLAAASRRTGTEIPLVAILVCGVALGIAYFRHHPVSLPAIPSPAPAPAAQPSPPPTPATQKKAPAQTHAPPPAVSTAVQNAKATAQGNIAAVQQQKKLAAIRAARGRLAAARAGVIKSLESDPNYQAAKAQADAADQQLRAARDTLPLGNPDRIDASEAALNAHNRLNQLIEAAMSKDAQSIAAQQQLDAALAAAKP